MKSFTSRLFNTLPKRLLAGVIIALGISLPVAASAAQTVTISAKTGVANVTTGDTSYHSSVNASYDQVVKVEVQYDNTEAPGSNLVANGVHIKINIPSTAGSVQKITTVTSGTNTNTVNGQAVVNLNRPDAYLQYIPGSAQAKITTLNGQVKNVVVPDGVLTSGQGYALNNGNPCQGAAVAVLARVVIPGVKIVKQSEILGQTNKWSNNNTAQPGDTMVYMITYQNTGNSEEDNVVIRDNLPPMTTLVPNTTYLYNQSNPNGVLYKSNNIASGGIVIGNYNPGGGAYVTFQVKLPDANQLACGQTQFRNVGVARPQNMNEYYNTAITDVTKACPSQVSYTCDQFNVTAGDNRTVTVSNFKYSATNGATFKDVVIDWGDQTPALTTNNVVGQNHQYGQYGSYTITAVAHFTVNGQDVTASGSNCTQTVSFASPTTPTTPAGPQPKQLVNTGPGDVIGIFGAITVAGAILHRILASRFAGSSKF